MPWRVSPSPGGWRLHCQGRAGRAGREGSPRPAPRAPGAPEPPAAATAASPPLDLFAQPGVVTVWVKSRVYERRPPEAASAASAASAAFWWPAWARLGRNPMLQSTSITRLPTTTTFTRGQFMPLRKPRRCRKKTVDTPHANGGRRRRRENPSTSPQLLSRVSVSQRGMSGQQERIRIRPAEKGRISYPVA